MSFRRTTFSNFEDKIEVLKGYSLSVVTSLCDSVQLNQSVCSFGIKLKLVTNDISEYIKYLIKNKSCKKNCS